MSGADSSLHSSLLKSSKVVFYQLNPPKQSTSKWQNILLPSAFTYSLSVLVNRLWTWDHLSSKTVVVDSSRFLDST